MIAGILFGCYGLRQMEVPQAPMQLSIADFGAVPNTREDQTEAINKAIQATRGEAAVLDFPKGEYHFYRENGIERSLFLSNSDVVNPRKIAILIEKCNSLTLKGNGSKLIFHDRVMPVAILGSKKIEIEGFTVDWERPLMSQGTVVESNSEGLTLKIDRKQYPYVLEGGKLFFTDTTWKREPWSMMEFDPKTRGVREATGDAGWTDGNWRGGAITQPKPGLVHFAFSNKRNAKVGDVMVIRHGSRDHAGTFVSDSQDVSFKDVKYRHTSGLGVLCQYTENLNFLNVDVAPEPKGERLFAGHDDGFHFSNCKGQIVVNGCQFEGLMDDPINVHGTSVQITEKHDSKTLKAKFMHGQSIGLRFGDPGDVISLTDHETLLSRGQNRLIGIKHLGPEELLLRFESPLPAALCVGDALENLTWTPSFTVRESTFGRVRARGLLVSTPKRVLVEDCLFRSSGAAILIAGDANGWFESGAVTNVTIRNNLFFHCNTSAYQFGEAIISIYPEIPKAGGPFHRGITIEDNSFLTSSTPVLWAKSVSGLVFRHNAIHVTNIALPSWINSDVGLTFLDCERVTVVGNHVTSRYEQGGSVFPDPISHVKIKGGKPETIQIKDW